MKLKTPTQLHLERLAERLAESQSQNSNQQPLGEMVSLEEGLRKTKYPPIIKGARYWMLTAIASAPKIGLDRYCLFLCDCGREVVVRSIYVKNGHTKSCGCLKSMFNQNGGFGSPEYVPWVSMRGRCLNPNNVSYDRYGERGIKICDRWIQSFDYFLSDMGPRPSMKHSIERIDLNGNYEPSNCKWATQPEQARNTSRNVNLTMDGKTMCLREWSRITGFSQSTLYYRLKRGMSHRDTLTMPRKKNQYQ